MGVTASSSGGARDSCRVKTLGLQVAENKWKIRAARRMRPKRRFFSTRTAGRVRARSVRAVDSAEPDDEPVRTATLCALGRSRFFFAISQSIHAVLSLEAQNQVSKPGRCSSSPGRGREGDRGERSWRTESPSKGPRRPVDHSRIAPRRSDPAPRSAAAENRRWPRSRTRHPRRRARGLFEGVRFRDGRRPGGHREGIG